MKNRNWIKPVIAVFLIVLVITGCTAYVYPGWAKGPASENTQSTAMGDTVKAAAACDADGKLGVLGKDGKVTCVAKSTSSNSSDETAKNEAQKAAAACDAKGQLPVLGQDGKVTCVAKSTTSNSDTTKKDTPPDTTKKDGAPDTISTANSGMPDNWVDVGEGKTGLPGLQYFNIDHDGSLNYRTFAWGHVVLLKGGGTEIESDLGVNVLYVVRDPNGRRLGTDKGHTKYQWKGANPPTVEQEKTLVDWWVRTRGTGNDWKVVYQSITNQPSAPVTAGLPQQWKQRDNAFYPAGDKKFTKSFGSDGKYIVANSWFNAARGNELNAKACTTVMSTDSDTVTYKGALRIYEFQGTGKPTKEDYWALARYRLFVLEQEPNGVECGKKDAYDVIWQDQSLAPNNPRGRP